MVTVYCECGEKYFADESHIGKKIQCGKCQRILTIQLDVGDSGGQSTSRGIEKKPVATAKGSRITFPILSQLERIPSHIGVTVLIILLISVLIAILPSKRRKEQAVVYPSQGISSIKESRSRRNMSLPNRVSQSTTPINGLGEIEPINPRKLPLGSAPFGAGIGFGSSTLTTDNGTDTDALVKLIRMESSGEILTRNFFIPSGQKFVAEELPSGDYIIRVAYGRDWDPTEHQFNFRSSFSESEHFRLVERQWEKSTDDGYVQYTRATNMFITLHEVISGNFQTHPISKEEFEKQSKDIQ